MLLLSRSEFSARYAASGLVWSGQGMGMFHRVDAAMELHVNLQW